MERPDTEIGVTGASYFCTNSDINGTAVIAVGSTGSATTGCVFYLNSNSYPCFSTVTGLPEVPSNAQLRTLPHTYAPIVLRQDVSPGFGAQPMPFTSSASPCSVDDGGSCVSASDGGSWIGQFQNRMVNPVEFGFLMDGAAHSGNAAIFQAALMAATNLGYSLWVPKTPACGVLDATVTSTAANVVISGPGAAGGACLMAAATSNLSSGLLYFSAAGANVTLQGFYIDGNQSNETAAYPMANIPNGGAVDSEINIQNTYGDGEDLNGSASVKARGVFTNIGTISSSNKSGVAVNIGQGCAESNCTLGASQNLDVDISVTNANFACLGIGYALGGTATVRCTNVNPTGAWGDGITAYYQGNSRLIYNLTLNGSGNHGAHIGGSHNRITGTINGTAYDGVLVESRYNENDGTITTSGNVITGSGVQTWLNCYHNCQRSSHYTDASGIFSFNGASYFVDHCTSNTSCVLATTPPTTSTPASYMLTWFGRSNDDWVDVSTSNTEMTAGGLHAGVQGAMMDGGGLMGRGSGFANQGQGAICADCKGTIIPFGSDGAFYAGVDITSSFEIGTATDASTINVVNGSTALVGNGTHFLSTISPGDICKDTTNNDAFDQVILSVTDDTHATWETIASSNYSGSTGSNHNYICAAGSNGVYAYADAIDAQSLAGPTGGFGVLLSNSIFSRVVGNYTNAAMLGFNDAGANAGNIFAGMGTVPTLPVHGDTVPVSCTAGVPSSSFAVTQGVITHC